MFSNQILFSEFRRYKCGLNNKYIYLGELFPMMRRTFKFFVNTYVTYSTVLSLLNCTAMHQDVPYFIILLYLTQDDFANASS